MKYWCELIVNEDVYDIFIPEIIEQNRSSLDIQKIDDTKTKFTIKAHDPIALRSSLNLVSKLLMIHDKTEKVIKKYQN